MEQKSRDVWKRVLDEKDNLIKDWINNVFADKDTKNKESK